MDKHTIINSVNKTGRLLVVHEAPLCCGFGAEIVSEVIEEAFDYLDFPPQRIGSLDCPVPYEGKLESEVMPNEKRILKMVRSMVGKQ